MNGKLRCSAETCANNVNQFCIAGNILVTGSRAHKTPETACETFVEKDVMRSRFTDMNLAGQFRQLFSGESVEISPGIMCEAENCIYNINRICSADSVKINGPDARASEETQCETFREEHNQ